MYSAEHAALEKIEELIQVIALEPEFRAALYAQVGARFDGESNVLLAKLCEAEFNDNTIKATLEEIQDLLVLFIDKEGIQYYPQIYIPNYDDLKNRDVLGSVNPVTIRYFGDMDPEPDFATGLVLDDEGDLIVLERVEEAFTDSNEVWVLSINERVDKMGVLNGSIPKANSCVVGEVSGGDSNPNIDVVINKIRIREHKESWLAGGSEIHMLGFRTYWNGYSPMGEIVYNAGLAFDGPAYEGPQIKWVSRPDVDIEKQFTVDFSIVSNWWVQDFHQDAIVIGYVIFEFDSWPAGKKVATVYFPDGVGGVQHIDYRSKNSPYYSDRWLGSTLNGAFGPAVYNFHADDARIEFNLCWDYQ